MQKSWKIQRSWRVSVGLLIIGFLPLWMGCNDDDDTDSYVYEEPIVAKVSSDGNVVMDSQYGPIQAPQIRGRVENNSYILTWFYMDFNVQPYTVSDFANYGVMGGDTVTTVQGDMSDGYQESIKDVTIYLNNDANGFIFIDNTFFIKAGQDNQNEYQYELLLNTDSVRPDNVPALYLRARKIGSTNPWGGLVTPFGLNLGPILSEYGDASKKEITFYLMYKTGTDTEGKDSYTSYKNNPVTLKY